jgi:2,4-dienoyl-CoA reductase-like NADH-dependent reductase (Old Yellow Enzyme family)
MWKPPDARKHPIPPANWPKATKAAESLLFAPLSVGSLTIEQRTWVPAMVPWRATGDGEVTDALIEWYARFAAGQPGVIVIEATGIRDIPSGPLLRIGDDRYIEGLHRLTDAVREASGGKTRLFIQLIDFLTVKRRPPAEKYFRRFLRVTEAHREALQLDDDDAIREALLAGDDALHQRVLDAREYQALAYGYREQVNDTHLPEIADLPQTLPGLFARAATRARTAGFDGVELHYAHAYTMASFLSRTNMRTDGYGGSPEARVKLPLEVYEAVRTAVGDDYVVGCRFLVDEVFEGGSRVEDAEYYGTAFARAGMDFVSMSKGGKFDDAKQPRVGQAVYPYTGESGYECMPTVYSDAQGPFARNIAAMARVRRAIRDAGLDTPTVVAGGLNDFEQIEGILQRGEGDIIGSARQSLADPDWWTKMKAGNGESIARCKMTNYCEALDNQHKQVTCQLWDRIDITEPGVRLSHDGRRRLTSPT